MTISGFIASDALMAAIFALLLAVLVAAEIYVHVRGIKGTLVGVAENKPCREGGVYGVGITVRLETGEVVDAVADPCGLCASGLRAGDRVTLARSRGGYVLAHRFLARK